MVVTSTHRRARDKDQRKAEILQAARAVFAQAGFRRTTIEAVAERAEVGKGTIYLYFESKEALRAELLLQALADLTSRLKAAAERSAMLYPEQQLLAMAETYIEYAQNAPDYFRLLNAYDRDDFEYGIAVPQRERLLEARTRALDLVTQAIADGMALGLFQAGDPGVLAGVLWGAINGALGLMAHPIRRTLIPSTDGPGLCRITVELFLRSIARGDRPVAGKSMPDTSGRT